MQRRHRLNGMRPANHLRPCFRQAEVLDLALLNQFLHRAGHIFDGHLGVNAVLIEQIDRVDAESLQRALHGLLDVLRPAVQTRWMGIFVGLEIEPKLRCDHYLVTHRSESFAYNLFIHERTVNLSRIEEGDATLAPRMTATISCLVPATRP